MPESMQIPRDWLREARVESFTPAGPIYRCIAAHVLLPLGDIEPVLRIKPLDANGFAHDRMISILEGMRDDAALPPVPVERLERGVHPYRLRNGTHRFYASVLLGYSDTPTYRLKYVSPQSPARELAILKLRQEANTLAKRPPRSVGDLLGLEGRAANAYFTAWQGLPMQWKGLGRHPIPRDWHGQRYSFARKKGGNRNATHP